MGLRPIAPAQLPPNAGELIPADAPTRARGLAVLDGVLSGFAWVDDPVAPRELLVIEDADGTVFAGGPPSRGDLMDALAGLATRSGDLIFGFAGLDDPLRDLVPAEPYWRGEAIDFTERHARADEADRLATPPRDGARLVRLDRSTLPQTAWYEDTLHAFGSIDRWEENAVGFGIVVGNELVAESVAGPRVDGLLEMGVATREPHRRKGFGTLVSLAVARACEERGDRVWWNTNAMNVASIAIARRLGFAVERGYDLVACRAPLA
jgi:RimJ/RimL family protein N-acetyltransferase